MYLWRRWASQKWWSDNEKRVRATADDRLAIIEEAGRKRLQLEVASPSRTELQRLTKQFDGRVLKLPHDWLKRFSRQQTEPIRIGKRLVIVRSVKDRQSVNQLIIPSGAAFGTGQHATTAMSLRMLERVMRFWEVHASSRAIFGAPAENLRKRSRSRGHDRQHARRVRSPELIVDLGTGTGILALAAKRFGANRVIGIDHDPVAIATAKKNARLNKIHAVQFRVGDVRRWKSSRQSRLRGSGSGGQVDIVTANLFSELLIEILPKLKATRWMILSGILRDQERDVTRALRRHKIDIVEVRRCGKWVAILATVR
ncbi:MAG TPA: 50S ribosomal protein L11 methyltransferase [Chthoniobacterales bacterium]|jgi:ribosomal protein L11 methyltransferase|nr:50S ribosomal protein L11 methyltransferase [Chthoniobacterales bacterium]